MKLDLYRNKYKGTSMRLPHWDYRRPGGYFVTLCTKNRKHFFGNVVAGKMQLSAMGQIAGRFWREISDHCENVRIDEYVVMPNHVHGILMIERRFDVGDVDDVFVEAFHGTPLRKRPAEGENFPYEISSKPYTKSLSSNGPFSLSQKVSALSPKRGSLSTIVRSYKSSVTRWYRQNGYAHFEWQPRFYESVIRTDGSIDYIRRYIVNNPRNWQRDRNNVRKLSLPTLSAPIT